MAVLKLMLAFICTGGSAADVSDTGYWDGRRSFLQPSGLPPMRVLVDAEGGLVVALGFG